MGRPRLFSILLAAASIAAVCAPLRSQTTREVTATEGKEKFVPELSRPTPFSIDTPASNAITFLPVDRMTQRDRDLVADAESSIGARAGFAGLEFNQGQWSYRQIVCTTLPNHLFLAFVRNNGEGDVSLFSVSIPRSGEGRMRIIPIQRRGYSLFSPASINSLTISVFNHIRAEDHSGAAPDWLGSGLCYAALAGAHPQLAPLVEEDSILKLPVAPLATLEISNSGGAVIRFADIAAPQRPMEWTMTFDGKGVLLKTTQSPASVLQVKAVEPAGVDLRGKPVPEAPVDLKGKPIL
jgi:hypothetical protein